eukprot:13620335-Ditylum_brightwellii.AAC.1
MPHYNRDDYSSSALSEDSSFEGFVMPHYNRDDYSSNSSEEDYSTSKEESSHSTKDTTLISMYSDELLFAELSCEEQIDLDTISKIVEPITVQNGKHTKKNEEKKCQKVSMVYDPLGRPGPMKWNGKKGTIQDICDVLKLLRRKHVDRSIQNILKKCNLLQKDEVYDLKHKDHVHTKEILSKDQKQHLADTVEKNYASI